MDGELSASEASAFDQSLTSEERERLTDEIALERALVELLGTDAPCPKDTWGRIQAQVGREWVRGQRPAARRWLRVGAGLAAALLVAAVGVLLLQSRVVEPAFLRVAEADVAALAATAEVGGDLGKVRDFLVDHGFEVDLKPPAREPEGTGHTTRLLGVREGVYGRDSTVELLFDCCGEPMKLILARQNGPAAKAIGQGLATGLVQTSEPVGPYVAAVVGSHQSPGLVEYVRAEGEKLNA
jgi:hypothetical protein